MIIIDHKHILKQEKFGDRTLKCAVEGLSPTVCPELTTVTWAYDNDSELFALVCITDFIKANWGSKKLILELPYIPNARQDRFVSGRLFTLKTFCRLINSLEFDKVVVLDPHSTVATALLDNVDPRYVDWKAALPADVKNMTVMYPDAGAAKKYAEAFSTAESDVVVGNKHRNREGRITDYELLNFVEGTREVLIQDDIASFGGTFIAAAKALRERGVEKVYLAVSHCEYNIFKGDVFKYIDKVYTTDSILDLNNPEFDIEGLDDEKRARIEVLEFFRKVN